MTKPKYVIILWLSLIFGGAFLFGMVEGVHYFDAIYWAVTTASTTGYGDISPGLSLGKVVAMLTMLLSAYVISPLVIAYVIMHYAEDKHQFTDEEQKEILEFVRRQNGA